MIERFAHPQVSIRPESDICLTCGLIRAVGDLAMNDEPEECTVRSFEEMAAVELYQSKLVNGQVSIAMTGFAPQSRTQMTPDSERARWWRAGQGAIRATSLAS